MSGAFVTIAFDLVIKHQWGIDHRCPECRGWDPDYRAELRSDPVGRDQEGHRQQVGHFLWCDIHRVADYVSRLRNPKPVLKQGVPPTMHYEGGRPSDRGCKHSAQSWYIKDGLTANRAANGRLDEAQPRVS